MLTEGGGRLVARALVAGMLCDRHWAGAEQARPADPRSWLTFLWRRQMGTGT